MNRLVVGLNIGLVRLRLSEQIIGINCDADPVKPVSGLAGSQVDRGWHAKVRYRRVLLFVDVAVVDESFVDSHNLCYVWWLLLSWVYGFEDMVVARFVPGVGLNVPRKGLLTGVVPQSGFGNEIDT